MEIVSNESNKSEQNVRVLDLHVAEARKYENPRVDQLEELLGSAVLIDVPEELRELAREQLAQAA